MTHPPQSLEAAVEDAQENALYRVPPVFERPMLGLVDAVLLTFGSVWATVSWQDVMESRSATALLAAVIWSFIGVGIITHWAIESARQRRVFRRELMHWAAKAGAQRWDARNPTRVPAVRRWRYDGRYWSVTAEG